MDTVTNTILQAFQALPQLSPSMREALTDLTSLIILTPGIRLASLPLLMEHMLEVVSTLQA